MFKKISPRKISDDIIEQFKEMLAKGEIKQGDELPSERVIAESIGVSRPPLREALNVLQAMGFIEIKPRSKIIVKSVSKSLEDPLSILLEDDIGKVFELLDIRRELEAWAASKAAENATGDDIERLRIILYQDQENLKNGRNDAKTDADFHVAISVAAHNTVLSHLMAFCYNLLWNTQRIARERIFKKEGNRELICSQHIKLFEAIKDRNSKVAGKEARKHIDFVESELRRITLEEAHR
ncbi:MAG: FadR family transcriptional regulator [Deltaproteobacteria bacterium]|nr:FadR family transcriptional regulator [Deltaproteobacteria bacterium]